MLLIEFADGTRLKMVGFGDAEGFGRQPDGLEVTDPCGLDATMARKKSPRPSPFQRGAPFGRGPKSPGIGATEVATLRHPGALVTNLTLTSRSNSHAGRR